MRATFTLVGLTAGALLMTGCGDAEPAPASSSETEPASSAAPDQAADEPTEAPSEEPTEAVESTPTDLPADLLPEVSGLPGEDEPREETQDVVAWHVPCEDLAPEGATAMRTVTWGTGEFEMPVPAHQVAVFDDAERAVAAADTVRAAMQRCVDEPDPAYDTVYRVDEVAVGAQGRGLMTDYYGWSEEEDADWVMGSYQVAFRRGNAVALVAVLGGEGDATAVSEAVVEEAQDVWDRLCRYDSAGC